MACRHAAAALAACGPVRADTVGRVVLSLRAHLTALAGAIGGPTVPAVAACWALLGWRLHADWALFAYGYLTVAGVVLARVDLVERRLPDALTLPAYPITGALLVAAAALGSSSGSVTGAALGGVAMWAVYVVLRLAHPAGMGLGDVKLAGVLGLAAGWFGWATWTVALLAAFGFGAAVSLVLLATRRAGRRTVLPFGPFMLAGALLAVLHA